MDKVKIGKVECIISKIKHRDVKRMNRYREEKKLDAFDFDTYVLLYNLKKANPDIAKMTIDELDEMFDPSEFEQMREKINDYSGFNKYIGKLKEKNLAHGIGKK